MNAQFKINEGEYVTYLKLFDMQLIVFILTLAGLHAWMYSIDCHLILILIFVLHHYFQKIIVM